MPPSDRRTAPAATAPRHGLVRVWPHERGAHLRIARLAIDTGYEAPAVYSWSRAQGFAQVSPVKGVEGFNRSSPVSGPTFVDATEGGKRLRRGARLWTVAVSTFKAETYRFLRLARPTDEEMADGAAFPPGSVHLPHWVENEWLKQFVAEQLVTVRTKRGFARLEWQKLRERNEALDCRVYASGTTRVSYDGKSVDYGSAEDLLARIRTIERAIAGKRAVSAAIREAGTGLKAAWRLQITGAGLGARLARTIRSEQFPKATPSLNAATVVWSNAPIIVGAHDTGPLIRSKNGFWLAIPTPAAGKSLRGGRITPGEWERRTGLRLRFIYRRRGPSLLVAEGRLNTKGRAVASRSKTGRGLVTAPIFLLVPQVNLPKRLDLARDAERVHDAVPGLVVANWVDS